jgi:hypothetical protein
VMKSWRLNITSSFIKSKPTTPTRQFPP